MKIHKASEDYLEAMLMMQERHKLLTEFFLRLGVDEATAREDACKVEHDISEKTFDAICAHAKRRRDDAN